MEVSTDDGHHWDEAQIFSNPDPSRVWAFWKYVWLNPPRGKQTIKVRATDGNGTLQSPSVSGEWPEGASGYHYITVEVA